MPSPITTLPPPHGRAATVAVVVLLLALGAGPHVAADAGCLLPPVDAPVTDPFRLPACTYCPGNRGIEFGPAPGSAVVAAASGEVTFAGTVAGVRWIVVRHGDGLLASYGRLDGLRVRAGQEVAAGEWIATTTERFYFGLRDGDLPVDPGPLLGRRRYPTRLVPSDGSPARPAGPGRLVCGAAPPGRPPGRPQARAGGAVRRPG